MVAAKRLPIMSMKAPPAFKLDKTQDGWKLLEDTPFEGLAQFWLSNFFEDDEDFIGGKIMLERGKNTAEQLGKLAGQHHAEAIHEHQNKIPAEWQSYDLIFGGTVWQGYNRSLWVTFLHWSEGCWVVCFGCVEGNVCWRYLSRLVRVSV